MSGTNEHQTYQILIYIPCHVDFNLAFENVKMINEQLLNVPTNDVKFKIKIIVSINGVPSFDLPSLPSDVEIVRYGANLGGDINIALGFIRALEIKPIYFWLLSANEILQQDAVLNLLELLTKYNDVDIFVANAANRENILELESVYFDLPPKLGLGLISSVIYKFERTSQFYMEAVKYNWTGWGQLAVVQKFLMLTPDKNVLEFPYEKLFHKPFTYVDEGFMDERTFVRSNYRHSFYGLPILVANSYFGNKKLANKALRNWLRGNWYKINFFKLNSKELKQIENKPIAWSHSIFSLAFKNNSRILWTIMLFLEKLPFLYFKNFRVLQILLNITKK